MRLATALGLVLLALQRLLLPAAAVAPPPPPGSIPAAAAAAAASSSSNASQTGPTAAPSPPPGNRSLAERHPVSELLQELPAVKAAVIGACAASAGLVACLLLRVFRSGRKIKKTRKYDIITTPAERVEMAPLNEDEDDDEDSTVFDIKYR
ncbi:membrane protein FAM174B [Hemicordylus capensis]|uniref:membrane protein FAM174B n=1 Tax=Hemicordylus capensis TaxID=884348 RepID=UPI002302C560|nr:membrane protein FAM174B [Hemicordylus capensis]